MTLIFRYDSATMDRRTKTIMQSGPTIVASPDELTKQYLKHNTKYIIHSQNH